MMNGNIAVTLMMFFLFNGGQFINSIVCPSDEWVANNDTNKCYLISLEEIGSQPKCEIDVCGSYNASLVCIESEEENMFLKGKLQDDWFWIGLYQSANASSKEGWDNWSNGCNSTFKNWYHHEPDDFCEGEACVVINPWEEGKWFDSFCGEKSHCLCEWSSQASPEYLQNVDRLNQDEYDDACDCPFISLLSSGLMMGIGIPCFLVMAYCVVKIIGVSFFGSFTGRSSQTNPYKEEEFYQIQSISSPSSYGMLIDSSNMDIDAENIVNKWIIRGAWAAILYAIAFIALGFFHYLWTGFLVLAIDAIFMFVCKLIVAYSAHVVHKHITPLSRRVAGNWIHYISLSKLMMALMSLMLSIIYFLVFMMEYTDSGWDKIDLIVNFFFMSLMVGMVFQTSAGFCFYKIYERATSHADDKDLFFKVVGWSWTALVCGTFGVGVGFWLAFALSPWCSTFHHFLIFAGYSQVIAGVAMMKMNSKIKEHFSSPNALQHTVDTTIQMREYK